jgi:hypothetical protein
MAPASSSFCTTGALRFGDAPQSRACRRWSACGGVEVVLERERHAVQQAAGGRALRVGGARRGTHGRGIEMDEGVERRRLVGARQQGVGVGQGGRFAAADRGRRVADRQVGRIHASSGKGARPNDHTARRAARRVQPSARSAAWTIAAASTSKWARSAARVSLRPKPSVPSVTQRRPGGRKARICSGTART